MRRIAILLAVGVVAAVMLALVLANSIQTGRDAFAQRGWDYKLASLDAGQPVAENDLTIARFRFLLESLRGKTGYSDERLADITVSTQNTLRDRYGKKAKLLDLMEAGKKGMDNAPSPSDTYEEIMAAITVIYGQ